MSNTVVQEQLPAPDFTLPAIGDDIVVKDGQTHLGELKGQTIVLYFYPKDDTPGCTKEACSFRDAHHAMRQQGIVVLGVSGDSINSHKQFADKYGLSFPLLADTDKAVSQLYGIYGEHSVYGRTYIGIKRATFLIDKDGIVRKIWDKVKPEEHAKEVLEMVKELNL